MTVIALLINRLQPLLSTMLVAIVLGALIGNLRQVPMSWRPGLSFSSKHLLRTGIVLLGLQISLATLAGLGWQRLVLVVVVVSVGVTATMLIGRVMKISRSLTMLVACGFSICGAAAVAGTKDVSGADEEETGTALGLVVLFGTLSIPVVPLLAGLIGLDTPQAATWAGASIHEVAQVVAAAAAIGPDALAIAVPVKLARVVCLAGVVPVLGLLARRTTQSSRQDQPSAAPQAASLDDASQAEAGSLDATSADATSGPAAAPANARPTNAQSTTAKPATANKPALIPGFVLGFLAMVVLGTFITLPAGLAGAIKIVQSATLAMAMAALGFGIQIRAMREVGLRPVLLGLIATIIVSLVALGGELLIS